MSMKKLWVLLLVVPFLVATQVMAQGLPTGVLNGRVAETEGLPLPGVSVTVKSPALQGSRTAVTNVNGDYTVPNLPPGDYVVTFVMSGFQSLTRNVKISSGQVVPVNAKLSISAVAAEATVVAQSETVSQTSQAATTYSSAETNKLPTPRNIASAVTLTPGATYNFNATAPNISGAQSFDTVITVNGVNVQDPVRGQQTGQLTIEDSIQETTTMTSGVSAEYGRFTGGVINAVTKQGGNTFSGSARVTLRNDDFQAQTPIKQTYQDKLNPTYEATLGGPIWKDRIWFFGAGRYAETEGSRSSAAPSSFTLPTTTTDTRYEGKLTITPFQSHTLTASYTNGLIESENYTFPYPILDTRVAYPRQNPSDLLSLNYNGVLTSNLFIEAQYSKKQFTFQNSGGRSQDLIEGTALLASARGNAQFWSPIFCAVCPGAGETRDNNDYLVKGTYFLSTKNLGTHNIVFGYQNFGIQRTANNWQSGSAFVMYTTDAISSNNTIYPVIDENTLLLYYPIPKLSSGADIRTGSFFVNDTWKVNNQLSVNLGLRYDKNDATDQSGATTVKDSSFSPRLSASYDVKGDGKLRVSASYARYVGQIQETIAGAASSAGSPASYYYYWTGKNYNTGAGPYTPTDQVLREMFAAWGVTGSNMFPSVPADASSVPGVNVQIKGNLKSPYADEYVLGVGGTIGQNLVYRVDGVRREFKRFYAIRRDMSTGQVTDPLGNEFDLGLQENSDLPEREYTGLHTSLAYRLHALNLSANWTWSHTLGNFNGESTGSGPGSAPFLNYPEYFDPKWNSPRGSLQTDQRHAVRLLASYDFRLGPVGLTPGLIQYWDTGLPYGASGSIAIQPYVSNPGYVQPPTRSTYFFLNRDTYRTDTISRTDLSFNVSAFLGPVEIFVQPQVRNLFNNQGITAVNSSVLVGTTAAASASSGLKAFNPFTTSPIECPQTATAAECKALGANWKKGPSYGQATSAASYQLPRTWFVTMGVRF